MLKINREIVVRTTLGIGVVVALALLAGVESAIEAKPPLEVVTPARVTAATPVSLQGQARQRNETMAMNVDVATPVRPSLNAKPTLAPTPATTIAPNKAEPFEMSSAERVSIRFQGYSELTGEYRINSDNTISVPGLGRINVLGRTPAELEATLAERATKVTGREAFITLEVSEYKPVFVSGYVSRPGSIPWKPGMSVLHAVTLMGGVFRATQENAGGIVIGADNEIVRLKRATSELKRTFATIARLEAERTEKDAIAVPDRLVALVGKAEAERLIAEQNTALVSRRVGLAAQLATLDRAKRLAEQEYDGLKSQSARIKDMLNVRREYKQKIEGLQAKGIVRADRGMEETAKVGDLEDRMTIVSVGMARVQGMIAGFDRDVINLRQERIAGIDTDILKLDRDVALLELEIDAARTAYRKITGMPPPATLGDKEPSKVSVLEYEIVRWDAGKQVSMKAEASASLRPGDVLVVSTRHE